MVPPSTQVQNLVIVLGSSPRTPKSTYQKPILEKELECLKAVPPLSFPGVVYHCLDPSHDNDILMTAGLDTPAANRAHRNLAVKAVPVLDLHSTPSQF